MKKTCVSALLAAGILLGQATGQQALSVDDVEKMLAVDKVAERAAHQLEVWGCPLLGRVGARLGLRRPTC